MTTRQERIRQEVHEEHVEMVYGFLRTHPRAALHWIDINRDGYRTPVNPEIEPGDPSHGFWEIYSHTTYEDGYPIHGDDFDQLAYEIMDWSNE